VVLSLAVQNSWSPSIPRSGRRGPPRSSNLPSKPARRHQNLGRDNAASSR